MLNQELDISETQGDSAEYITTEKCRLAAERIGGAVMVEDTSLCFNALAELPGPFIKWFLAKLGHEGLNNMLAAYEDKTAFAQCIFAVTAGPGAKVHLFVGRTHGRIVPARGPTDFGWDPIFEPAESQGLTYAEMEKEEKNAISHRFRALSQLREFLQTQGAELKEAMSSTGRRS